MSFRQLLDEDRRLVALRALCDCGGSANESVLQTCLEQYGHRISRDLMRSYMSWLAEQGLIKLQNVVGCFVADITGRGEDVATGRATVLGVKKPRASDYD